MIHGFLAEKEKQGTINIGKMQKQEESHIVCIMNQSYFAPVYHRINNTGKSHEANRIFPE